MTSKADLPSVETVPTTIEVWPSADIIEALAILGRAIHNDSQGRNALAVGVW